MAIHDLLLLAAGLAASATCLVHVFLGGRLFARPLLASGLRPPVKHTMYFCWHLVTASLVVMAGAYFWAAFSAGARAAAIVATALAGACLIVNAVQNIAMRLPFVKHPQGAFFFVVAALGAAGLVHG
jgi:hypothetical protein